MNSRKQRHRYPNGGMTSRVRLVVEVGLAGDRVISFDVELWSLFRHAARDVQNMLKLDNDVEFVAKNETNVVNMFDTVGSMVKDSQSMIELRAVVVSNSWKIKLTTAAPYAQTCGCAGHDCCLDVWGPSLTLNVKALQPAFKRGAITKVSNITKQILKPDWDQDHAFHTAGYDLTDLREKTRGEYLWSCAACDNVAFVALQRCRPDTDAWPWQRYRRDRHNCRVMCGRCLNKLAQ